MALTTFEMSSYFQSLPSLFMIMIGKFSAGLEISVSQTGVSESRARKK